MYTYAWATLYMSFELLEKILSMCWVEWSEYTAPSQSSTVHNVNLLNETYLNKNLLQ